MQEEQRRAESVMQELKACGTLKRKVCVVCCVLLINHLGSDTKLSYLDLTQQTKI